ncbi:TonB-dependent receptor [Azotobacter chroococcum]|uniref:TonB-dependent receptor n=1 Tax=Azotobacter chroococcum TaxID=353 RepID=A0AA43Z6F9_9GAMM|nr:TonB-dependent receptor [Azotobacter chroococcum]NHN76943.1 TonB-dependent receptor [Azotobacter chroococcum]
MDMELSNHSLGPVVPFARRRPRPPRVVHKWEGDRLKSTLLMGLDYQKLDIDDKDYASDPLVLSPIDIYNPGYGGRVGLVTSSLRPVADAGLQDFRTRFDQLGLYLQEQVKFDDRWVLLLGGRYDRSRAGIDNRTTGVDKNVRACRFWSVPGCADGWRRMLRAVAKRAFPRHS